MKTTVASYLTLLFVYFLCDLPIIKSVGKTFAWNR